MDIQKIVRELKAERQRIDKAIVAVEDLGGPKQGRPVGTHAATTRPKRHMSAASRKRVSEMMKQRWAQKVRSAKAGKKKGGYPGPMMTS